MVDFVFVKNVVDNFIGRTLQGKLLGEVANYIVGGIKGGSGSVQLPLLQRLFQMNDEYRVKCINIYNGVFGLNEYVVDIPDEIKAAQGAVLDGLCFMFDMVGGRNLGIVTLNNRLIDPSEEDIVDAKVEAKIMEMNRIGLIHSYRYDFEYDAYGYEKASVKCVKHRTKIDEENVVLIPFVVVLSVQEIISQQMKKGNMLAVKMVRASGEEKVRVITENHNHLAHYCDDSGACAGLVCEYYTMGAFLYAPVMGAPSTTAMKTRVDVFDLDNLMVVQNYSTCAKLGVLKVEDAVERVIKEEVVIIKLRELEANNKDEYLRVVGKLMEGGSNVFSGMMDGDISSRTVTNYMHTISNTQVDKILGMVGGREEYEKRAGVFNKEGGRKVESVDLSHELRHGVLKVVWKKANGMYASSICTNSPEILRKVYGDDYFSKYESFGVRVSNAASDIEEVGMPVDVACRTYGFDETVVQRVNELLTEGKTVTDCFYEALGKKRRASNSNPDVITARTLGGYLGSQYSEGSTQANAEGYYVSIDKSHLVRAEVIG